MLGWGLMIVPGAVVGVVSAFNRMRPAAPPPPPEPKAWLGAPKPASGRVPFTEFEVPPAPPAPALSLAA
jgi:hypothetical protein